MTAMRPRRPRSRLVLLAPAVLAAAALAACGGSSSGSAAAPAGSTGSSSASAGTPTGPVWGIATASGSEAGGPTGKAQALPAAAHAGSPAAGGAVTVVHQAIGRYRVMFPGLGVAGGQGVATASARTGPAGTAPSAAPAGAPTGGSAVAACRVTGWEPSGGDEAVDVACAAGSGTPADSAFTTMFTFVPATVRLPGQPYAYLRDDAPSAAKTTPADSYNYGQPGGVTVTRDTTGHYTVFFAGAGFEADGSNLQVNAVGTGGANCNALGRVPVAGGQNVFVGCATGAAPADSPFTLVFAARHALVPADVAFAYAFPGLNSSHGTIQPPLGATKPAWAKWSANSAGQANTVTHLATGSYQLTLPGVAHRPDFVAVSPYGDAVHRCAVSGVTSPASGPFAAATVSVGCVDPSGAPADSYFSLTYLSVAPGGPATPIP
jgi:hypothetical protein